LQLFSLKYIIYSGLLKTALSCRQFSSHRRHEQSCLVGVGGVNEA